MKRNGGRLSPLIFAVIISLFAITLLVLISGFILMKCEDPSGHIGLATIMLFPFSGAVSAICTRIYKKDTAIKESIIAASAVSALILTIALIISGGKLSLSVVINLCVFILSTLVVSYLARAKGRRRRR